MGLKDASQYCIYDLWVYRFLVVCFLILFCSVPALLQCKVLAVRYHRRFCLFDLLCRVSSLRTIYIFRISRSASKIVSQLRTMSFPPRLAQSCQQPSSITNTRQV